MIHPRLAVALAALAVLAGCTDWGPGPDIAGATANGVTVRYDSAQVAVKDVEEVAQSYCRGLDKQARLRSRFAAEPTMTYADYGCVRVPPGGR